MPSSKSMKKGFKSVSTKSVKKESLTYEDVEDEHTITPTAPKKEKSRKDKSKAETQSSGRKRSRSNSADNSDGEQQVKHNKKHRSKPEVSRTPVITKSTDKEKSSSKKKSSTKKVEAKEIVAQEEKVQQKEKTLITSTDPVKTYYPKIPFDHIQFAQDITAEPKSKKSKKRKSTSSSSEKSHQEKATALLSAICSSEQKGLEEFFTTSHSSRDNVLQRLSAVISKLPDAVQEYLDDSAPSDGTPLEFEPELSSHERTLIQKRHEYLQNMSMEINKLQSYLDSMTELESDFGSSAVGVPKPPVTKPTLELSSQNVEAEQVYTSHLNNLGAYVSSVQSRLDEINASMANARASQDELYDACQKVRFMQQVPSTSAGVSSSSSATAPPTPIFISSRNFETSPKGSTTRTRSTRHTSAKHALKKLQCM